MSASHATPLAHIYSYSTSCASGSNPERRTGSSHISGTVHSVSSDSVLIPSQSLSLMSDGFSAWVEASLALALAFALFFGGFASAFFLVSALAFGLVSALAVGLVSALAFAAEAFALGSAGRLGPPRRSRLAALMSANSP